MGGVRRPVHAAPARPPVRPGGPARGRPPRPVPCQGAHGRPADRGQVRRPLSALLGRRSRGQGLLPGGCAIRGRGVDGASRGARASCRCAVRSQGGFLTGPGRPGARWQDAPLLLRRLLTWAGGARPAAAAGSSPPGSRPAGSMVAPGQARRRSLSEGQLLTCEFTWVSGLEPVVAWPLPAAVAGSAVVVTDLDVFLRLRKKAATAPPAAVSVARPSGFCQRRPLGCAGSRRLAADDSTDDTFGATVSCRTCPERSTC